MIRLLAALCALLWALLPASALAEQVRIGFAPPTGRDLLYRIEQQRPVAGRMTRFSADRLLRFMAVEDGGYRLRATLTRIDTDAAGEAGEPYRVALSPLIGLALDFRVDAQGRITALDNMDAAWARVEAGLAAMRTGFAEGSARHRAVTNILALFSGQTADGRLALLSGEIQPLLLFANSVIDDERPRALKTVAGSPLGRPVPVEGLVALAGRHGDMLDLTENLAGQGVRVDIRYRLSRVGGVVAEERRTLEMGDRKLTETRSVEGLSN
ncbi:MAG: hypothetical protein QHC40_03650 [Sphingobium sp.]|nr:hypothetical protein [Sphingobium sp.]